MPEFAIKQQKERDDSGMPAVHFRTYIQERNGFFPHSVFFFCVDSNVSLVLCDEHCVVSLVWLQGQLLERFESLRLELFHLSGEHYLCRGSRVNTARLDRHEGVALVFEEMVCVQCDDTGLIGLGDVREDDIDEREKHAVFVGITRVFDDGDNVCPFLCHVDQVTARSVGELDSVHDAGRSYDVGDVADTSSAGCTKVQHLGTGCDEDFIETTKDTSSQLASERIPHAVLRLDGSGGGVGSSALDGYPLFAVNALPWDEILGDKEMLLAFGDENTRVTMRLEDNICTSSGAAPSASTTSTSSTRSTPATPSRTTTSTWSTSSPSS